MGGAVTSSSMPPELDALIETDSKILDQVRKDLSQEYILFMSRVMKERLAAQAGGGTPASDRARNASGPTKSS
jgi:hypothetical protein